MTHERATPWLDNRLYNLILQACTSHQDYGLRYTIATMLSRQPPGVYEAVISDWAVTKPKHSTFGAVESYIAELTATRKTLFEFYGQPIPTVDSLFTGGEIRNLRPQEIKPPLTVQVVTMPGIDAKPILTALGRLTQPCPLFVTPKPFQAHRGAFSPRSPHTRPIDAYNGTTTLVNQELRNGGIALLAPSFLDIVLLKRWRYLTAQTDYNHTGPDIAMLKRLFKSSLGQAVILLASPPIPGDARQSIAITQTQRLYAELIQAQYPNIVAINAADSAANVAATISNRLAQITSAS